MKYITEDEIELYNLQLLTELGYDYRSGYDIQPEGSSPERERFSDVILTQRLQQAIDRINPDIPPTQRQQAQRDILNIVSSDLLTNNEKFHNYITEGIPVEYQKNGETRGDKVWLIDWDNIKNNQFLAVNQLTVIEDNHNRRPDIVLFINGLPIVIIELKNAADSKANLQAAYNQIQTYKRDIPSLFTYNALTIISDGLHAKAGSLSANYNRFANWKMSPQPPEGELGLGEGDINELSTLTNGMLNQHTLLDLIRHFIVFEQEKKENPTTKIISISTTKKIAAYHQYHAVNKALESIIAASTPLIAKKLPTPPMGAGGTPSMGAGGTPPQDKLAYRGGLQYTTLLNRVLELRKNQTPAEAAMWEVLKGKQLLGLKFRRQHQIGNYIVDFYCHQHKLVIELDGGIHNEPKQQERDRIRTEYLNSLGHRVLRFPNESVFNGLEGVLDTIGLAVESPQPPKGELREVGDRRGGVLWHTQGSGKSLSMVFLAGKLVLALNNPTIVILTDRTDLDDQLFDTFAGCRQLLRQDPQQALDRDQVRQLLNVASGGIVFTTIQKISPETGETLYPQISPRTNIVVMADEAHRSQYGFKAKEVNITDATGEIIGKQTKYGFAKYLRDALPQATYIGFTGTPIEQNDKNTPELFGKYIDIYDIAQSVKDGATVPIYYESRLVQVQLNDQGRKLLDELDDDLQYEDLSTTQTAKVNQTKLEAIVGSTQRIRTIAQDIIQHFETRQTVNRGKGMIVTMSRRIAADLYAEIITLRPDWHSDDPSLGKIKVVMTSNASDAGNLTKHQTTKRQRKLLAQRLKDPQNPLELAIVCDMWLTGFDAPCLHTMYIDKPLKSHNLMQAIARINRVYFDKTGGLIVDYLGLAAELKKALSFYSDSGGQGEPALDQAVAIGLLLTKLELVQQIMAGYDYQSYFQAETGAKLNILKGATNYAVHPTIKDRFLNTLTALSQIYSLTAHTPEAIAVSPQISFFQAIQASLKKLEPSDGGLSDREIETAIRQVVDQALVSDTVINIFDDAGIQTPDLSIISNEFLAEVQGMEHQNLAIELLKKLLKDEIKAKQRINIVQSRKLSELLEASLNRYQNQVISITDVIQELIYIAKDVQNSNELGEELGLEPYELAFYDALAQNQSAQDVMGVDQLRQLAIVLVERIKQNTSIDWNLKESARARMKVMVKRLLKQYGYPPDLEALAIELVLEQAKVFTEFETDKLTNK